MPEIFWRKMDQDQVQFLKRDNKWNPVLSKMKRLQNLVFGIFDGNGTRRSRQRVEESH